MVLSMNLSIKVKANSRENKILKENGQVVIRIHAPAQDGKANKAIIEFLSEAFDVPKSYIQIVSGLTSSHKRISIADDYKNRVEEVLAGI